MPTTEQILNKSGTIYGQVGKSLQILNKRDKLKGTDNAYVSVSNLDSADAIISGAELGDYIIHSGEVYYYVLYGRKFDLLTLNTPVHVRNFAFKTATINKLIFEESIIEDYSNIGRESFADVEWNEQGGVIIDIKGDVFTGLNSFGSTSTSTPKITAGSIVNFRYLSPEGEGPYLINNGTFTNQTNEFIINMACSEDGTFGAPWGAINATINYDVTEFPD